ncbi:MAG: enoyl-CoA hydratase/isomerase family protein [Syntrophaceae bacterium]|nr:enoyl-CoA hydratase/isomerase family protein [Syntrophaceae bacterium]
MATMELKKEGDVFVLSLINGARANTITDDVIAEYNAVLDELEAAPGNAALVVASADPKYWSNGIDREWLMTMPPGHLTLLASSLDRLYLRMALLNMPTVGCLTGHTYAAAAILAATFDFRLMRADRGFFCFPEVDIHIPFTPIIHRIVDFLADPQVITELVLTGKRIGGEEALKMKVVSAIYPEETLLPKTMEFAEFLSRKDRKMYTKLKRNMRLNLVRLQQNLPDM